MRKVADEPNGRGYVRHDTHTHDRTHALTFRGCFSGGGSVYVPAGALWGAQDIQKMAQRGSIAELTITMAKHPSSLKVPFIPSFFILSSSFFF
jgi:hypothetical protein